MTKKRAAKGQKDRPQETAPDPQKKAAADRAELVLGRWVLILVPSIAVPGAIIVGILTSWGPAILVLAGTMLLGTIGSLWASVRTLSGDAPLPERLEILEGEKNEANPLLERKAGLLRALKDLEQERAIGKIDQADFDDLCARYREQVKEVLRQIDQQMDPLVKKAEEMAKDHLARTGLGDDAPAEPKTADMPEAGSGGADAQP